MSAPRLTCRELVEFLDDYTDGRLPGARREAFDAHLSGCPACAAYLRTYRDAVALGRASLRASDEDVPAAIPEQLVQAILAARFA